MREFLIHFKFWIIYETDSYLKRYTVVNTIIYTAYKNDFILFYLLLYVTTHAVYCLSKLLYSLRWLVFSRNM